MTGKALEIVNVTKKIGGKPIVNGVSFHVSKGEIMGFLGPNGAGKTSTIRMMLGLSSISDGDVRINGSSIRTNYKAAISAVGGLVENPDMYAHMTGYQNLAFFAKLRGKVDKARIAEVVSFVKLDNSIHKKVKTYSLGMKQRLGLAQAIYHRPSVLILDEPTNGLDPSGIHELRDLLRSLAEQQQVAILISSHLLSEMELICDRVAILSQGKLLDVLDVQAISQQEVNGYVIKVNATERAAMVVKSFDPTIIQKVKGAILELEIDRHRLQQLMGVLVQNGIVIEEYMKMGVRLEDQYLKMVGGERHG